MYTPSHRSNPVFDFSILKDGGGATCSGSPITATCGAVPPATTAGYSYGHAGTCAG